MQMCLAIRQKKGTLAMIAIRPLAWVWGDNIAVQAARYEQAEDVRNHLDKVLDVL